jgi:siroheme synthase
MDGSTFAALPVPDNALSAAVHVLHLDEEDAVATLPLGEIASGAVVAALSPGQLRPLAARLRDAGRAPSTPIIVLTDTCAPRHGRYETTLADPALPGASGLDRRVVVVIGDVTRTPSSAPIDATPGDDGMGFSMAGLAG